MQDNGGPTFTHALLSNSPAIDNGNPATPGSGGDACESTDQRGVSRPQGAACDIGAFEVVLADLSVTKSDSPDPAPNGDELVYTVTVTNIGPDPATDVVVTDTLPTGVTFVSATSTQASCGEAGGIVTCNPGTIASDGSVTITITVTVDVATTTTSITNTASASANEDDPVSSNDSASATTTVTHNQNQPPVCDNDSFAMDEDTIVQRTPPCSDPDGDTIDIEIVSLSLVSVSPLIVTVPSGTEAWNVSLTLNFNGSGASYSYRANDGTDDSNVATTTITVIPINDPPVLTMPAAITLDEGSFATFNLDDIVADIETADAEITWSATSSNPGQVVVAIDGTTLTITAIDDAAPAVVTLTATDNGDPAGGIDVTVDNLAPEVVVSPATATNFSGETHHISATFSDLGVNDAPWDWTIDWGDDSSDSGSTNDQSAAIVGSHQYFEPRDYTIAITVTDKDGDAGFDTQIKTVVALAVTIDIKPGFDPNSLNLNGNGVVALAVLGTADFDAAAIDVTTVLFGLNGDEAAPVHGGHIGDVIGDSRDDMVLHFREGELGIPDDSEGNSILTLTITGVTTGGVWFEGQDEVRITPNNEKSRGKGGKGPK